MGDCVCVFAPAYLCAEAFSSPLQRVKTDFQKAKYKSRLTAFSKACDVPSTMI